MKSLKWLVSCVLTDVGMQCDTATQRDYDYINTRIEHEGLSFLTITLPTLSTALERGLETGRFETQNATAFRKSRTGALPNFLSGLLSQVFDSESGLLLDNPSIDCISAIRQICLMFKKVNVACSEERARDAVEAFVECENDITAFNGYLGTVGLEDHMVNQFDHVSGILWNNLGRAYASAQADQRLLPKHGPGATAERIRGNRKYTLRTWHSRLQEQFPLDLFGIPNWNWLGHPEVEKVNIVEPDAEQPVRICLVPKTLKAPRVIAIEPVCMQYTQQALCEFLVREIQRGWYTSDRINFTDQTINQQLALQSSKNGFYATIDLSEASDRVSRDLVARMLRVSPNLLEALMCTRSTRAELPDGRILPLEKFASMGSATCFPVEAMVFFTIVTAAILSHNGSNSPRIRSNDVYEATRDIYVYGDDIIFPAHKVAAVLDWLDHFGLKVNQNKSFWTGRFRESCGMDAYDGERVTPVYLRELPEDGRSKLGLVSLVSFANQLYNKGYWHTARNVRQYVEDRHGPLPTVWNTSPGIGWNSVLGHYSVERWDPKHQSFKVKTYALSANATPDPIDGHGALLKFFLSRSKPEHEKSDFQKSVRRGDVRIKRRWVRPY